MNIGDRVRLLRENKGMTQEELATKLGYKSKSSVTHIEKGRDIPRSMVVKLADILDTTPSYLMGWEEEKWRIDPELNNGYPIPPGSHYARMKDKQLSLSIKQQQTKESVIAVPIMDIDSVNSYALDLTFGSDYDYAPLIMNTVEHNGTLIYVKNNTKYKDMKNKMYPLIDENNIVLLDYGAKPVNGDIVILEFTPGKCFICRYFRFDNYIEFQYPSMRSEQIYNDNPDFIRYEVRGVVKQIIKNI